MTASEAKHAVFLPDAGISATWKLAKVQLSRPRCPDPSMAEVLAELELRDLIARYAYTWDLGDIDALMSFFTDDCVVNNSWGSFSGTEEIRASYEQAMQTTPRRHHQFVNVVVRLSDDLREGWTTTYHSALMEPRDDPPRKVRGVIADHVVKTDEGWKIRAHSVCIDTVEGVVGVSAGPPDS